MAQFKRIFYQDLTKKRIIRHCEDVVFGGDNLSDKIGVYLYDNGEPYAGGGTVSGTVINSRGQTVPITTGEISGNLVTVTLEEAALAVPGIIGVYVKLTSGQQIATVLSAMFTAMPTETDQTIDPGTIIPSVTQLITDIQNARNSIPPEYTELLAAVAPTFSASTAYTAGSYVWQGGSLYRFTADHAAGSWTGTDAAAVSLANDVADLKSAFDNVTEPTRNLWTYGDISGTKGVSQPFNFTSGTTYIISCKITSNYTDGQNSRVSLTNNRSSEKVYGLIKHDGTRHSCTITATDDCTKIFFYAANTSTNSTGYNVSVSDIQIETGSETAYIPPLTANDYIERENVQALASEISTALSLRFALSYADAQTISDNTNYDTITSPGNYICTTAAHAATMTNAPANVAHRMFVVSLHKSSYIMQIAIVSNSSAMTIKGRLKSDQDVWYPSNSGDTKWVTFENDFSLQSKLAAFLDTTLTETGKAAEAKAVGDQIAEINDAIEVQEQDIESKWDDIVAAIGEDTEYVPVVVPAGTGYGDGKYWNKEQTVAALANSSNYYAYEPYAVSPGDTFKITIFEGSSSKQAPVLVVKSDYTILASYKEGLIGVKNFSFTIPDNGAYLLLTTTKTETASTSVKKGTPVLRKSLAGLGNGIMDFSGKNVAIIGDSISTNGDYDPETNPFGNVPEIVIGAEDVGVELSAYVTVYDVWKNLNYDTPTGLTIGGHTFTDGEIGTEVSFTPVEADIGKMVGKPSSYYTADRFVWWEAAQEKMGFNPVPACWSGSSLTSHEGGKKMYKASYAWHPAMIRKCGIRQPGTMNRIAPDVIIVYRGTNDFSHEPYVLLKLPDTEINGYPGAYPESDAVKIENVWNYGLADGMMVLVKKLREAYPNAIIVFATLNVFKRVNYSAYPTNNGINTLPQYNDIIRRTAESLGCGLIEFDRDGITFENCYSGGYVTDDADHPTHPSDKGHAVMGKRALLDLAKVNGME